MVIEFVVTWEQNNPGGISEYTINPIVNYKQYKDCFNHARSKSKKWGNTVIKLCTLEF